VTWLSWLVGGHIPSIGQHFSASVHDFNGQLALFEAWAIGQQISASVHISRLRRLQIYVVSDYFTRPACTFQGCVGHKYAHDRL